jgi:Flp pilus assembly protein TadG
VIRPRPSERGAATAELALGLPILVAVTIGLAWLLSVGVAQIRTVDAARETARAVARGDNVSEAVARGRRIAPEGARLTVTTTGGQVVATASGRVPGPGGLFAFLPGVEVSAEAVAVDEDAAGTGAIGPRP